MNKILEKLSTKVIMSRFTNELVYFAEDIHEMTEERLRIRGYKVVSDGINMIDYVDNCEDDCSNMYGVMKYKDMVYNLQDFYQENGFFDKDVKEETLIERLDVFKDR